MNTQAQLDTIAAASDKHLQLALSDVNLSEATAAAIRAELARREAQAGPSPGFGNLDVTAAREIAMGERSCREQAQDGPSPATIGNNAAINDTLMLEASQKIDELRDERDNARRVAVNVGRERDELAAENERLRALLAACEAYVEAYNGTQYAPVVQTHTAMLAAIEAAKEATK